MGLKETHPCLSVEDTIRTLDAEDKLHILLQGNGDNQFKAFWGNWRQLQPEHPIFESNMHNNQLEKCIPIMVHVDEGTTLKKKAIMIIQFQPFLGQGTRKRKRTSTLLGCNMLGHSMTNRVLWSVMLTRLYSGKKLRNKPLLKLIAHLSAQLAEAFYKGIQLQKGGHTLFLVPLCLKGDWPALNKVGNLNRHFGRLVTDPNAKNRAGICHLCRADCEGFEGWHDVSWQNMQRFHEGSPLPWSVEPDLVAAIPLPNKYKADWFKIDIFHTLHKGLMADIAANAIVFRPGWANWF